jgi:hypothetical protein
MSKSKSKPLLDLTCEECHKDFKATRFLLYCGKDCRQEAHYERRRKGLTKLEKRVSSYAIKECKGCGAEFRPNSITQRYCEKACYENSRNKAKRAERKAEIQHPVTAKFTFISQTPTEFHSTQLKSEITGPTEFADEIKAYLAAGGGVTVLEVATAQSRGVVRTNQVADEGLMIEGSWL